MSKRITSKYKICKIVGTDIWGTIEDSKSKFKSKSNQPKKGGKSWWNTDYKLNLLAKQVLRKYYGNITEKQFKNLYLKAHKLAGIPQENLIVLLEKRLDTVVFRLRFAKTVFEARQLVNHGHILVNGNKVDIASYQVKDGDLIQIKDASIPLITKKMLLSNSTENYQFSKLPVPNYLETNYNIMAGIFLYSPHISEVPYAIPMELQRVISFYSK